ncbi:galactoside alpha-(1,2)-fucosyltransferase 2-like [Discoglossus pictus]
MDHQLHSKIETIQYRYYPDLESSKKVIRTCNILQNTGLWTINSMGRLGNQMGLYATLYALAKLNMHHACILPDMYKWLSPIFNISLPVLSVEEHYAVPWFNYLITDWMSEEYKHINKKYVQFLGYINSWTFYHHIKDEILKEFSFHSYIKDEVNKVLTRLRGTLKNATFIGVHVRRGDYIKTMPLVWKGVIADKDYLDKAMNYFRKKYQETVFVVASNGIDWCKENIDNSSGDVYISGNGNESTPGHDFALLSHCNHTIMTIGTFGYWAGYLAGGETIYLTNFTFPDSRLLNIFRYEASFLPEWIGIPANLSTFDYTVAWPTTVNTREP